MLFHNLLQINEKKKAFTVGAEGINVYNEGSIYTFFQKTISFLKLSVFFSNAISDYVNDLARDTYSVRLNKNIWYDIVVPLGNSYDFTYILLEETL